MVEFILLWLFFVFINFILVSIAALGLIWFGALPGKQQLQIWIAKLQARRRL